MGLVDRFDAAKDLVRALRSVAPGGDVGRRAICALNASLDAYGRCLLALDASSGARCPRAETFANAHMFHRTVLFEILRELDVSHDGNAGARGSVGNVRDAVSRLVRTWDEVLFRAGVPCASTSSGVTGA